MGTSPSTKAVAAAASALLVAAVYVLRLDRAVGLVIDDAYYVMLGQSLAQGGPYALVSSAAVPILPSVPPVFPALLAIVFRIAPEFPANIFLLKSVSIVAMAGAGLATFWFARRVRALPSAIAWTTALAVALMPAFVFLATSTVMAECVFTLLQLVTVAVVDRAASATDPRRARTAGAAAAALAAFTWMIRSAGITLIAAAFLWLIWRRRLAAATAFVAVFVVCAAPWSIFAARHAPSAADRDRYGGSIAVAYGDAVRLRVAGTISSGMVDWSELPLRAARNTVNIFGRDLGGMIAPIVYRSAAESGEEVFSLGALGFLRGSMGNASPTIGLSLVLSALALVGYASTLRRRPTVVELLVPLTVAMLLVYPYWTFRFVLPLSPFVLMYLASGCREVAAWAGSVDAWRPARIFMLTIVAAQLLDHAQYIRLSRDADLASSIDWLSEAHGLNEALAWIQANVPSGTDRTNIASTNPALVYLRTGHKGVTFDRSAVKIEEWKALGVGYVAVFRSMEVPSGLAAGRVVYRDQRRRWWIVEI